MSFVAVQSFTNYIDAHIVLGCLKEAGINCWLKNEVTATVIPVWTTAFGEIELMVAEDQVFKAGCVLQTIDEEKKVNRLCPHCFSHNVEYISTLHKPANWLSIVVNFLFGSFKQTYHCFYCGEDFEQPLSAKNN